MTYTKDNIQFAPFPEKLWSFHDLTGQRFNRLTVLGYAGKFDRAWWWVECDCGTINKVSGGNLARGHSTSCGCYAREITSQRRQNDFTRTNQPYSKKLKNTWKEIHRRCSDSTNHAFKYYGERGITVCDRWAYFDHFITDMGEPPTAKHSIERLDNNGPYSPDNCVWAEKLQQANNTSTNHFITYQGKTQTRSQWAREMGIDPKTLELRFRVLGWSVEKALTTPVRQTKLRSTPARLLSRRS